MAVEALYYAASAKTSMANLEKNFSWRYETTRFGPGNSEDKVSMNGQRI